MSERSRLWDQRGSTGRLWYMKMPSQSSGKVRARPGPHNPWGQLVLLVGNLICVSYQFYHHVGLYTPQHKSDQPRACCVALSLAVAHLFMWEHYQHHNNDRNRNSLTALLCGGIVTGFLGAVLAIPVTSAHKAPLSFPSTFPWHVVDWWGLHEDMHTMIGVSDLLFLLGAVLVSGASV